MTEFGLTTVLAHAAHVYAREVEDECVLLDEVTGELHVLNGPASIVWRCLDGVSTLGQIADDIASVTGAAVEDVRRDVVQLATELDGSGLLAGAPIPSSRPQRDAPPPNT